MPRESTRRGARPGVRMPQSVYWRDVVRIGAERATSHFEDGNDSDHSVANTVVARSAGVLGLPGRRNRVANRAPATTPRAALESPSSRGNSPSKTGDIQQASKSEAMTETLVYKLSLRCSKSTRSTSNGTRKTSCFNCEAVWLEMPARFCGTLENSRRWAELSLCSSSVRQREPSRTVPCRTAKSKAN